ncbi:hypothetical protein MSPP1_003633 [Malassezia sp. CBS 17886]|nr:hypothetical protein MSPP1_003633 [Malassezia sp. CBS 17886]
MEEAFVEAIIFHRYNTQAGHLEYLIKWQKEEFDMSWEPEDNAVDAEQLVYDYWTQRVGADDETARGRVRSMGGRLHDGEPRLFAETRADASSAQKEERSIESALESTPSQNSARHKAVPRPRDEHSSFSAILRPRDGIRDLWS